MASRSVVPDLKLYDLTSPRDHARAIMVTARKIVKTGSSAKEWVTRDERGTFEARAAELSASTAERRVELGLSDEAWTQQAAEQIILEALLVLQERARRGS